jgi:ubiquinone/menaquinone biosynthesis C-methylase UbiE
MSSFGSVGDSNANTERCGSDAESLRQRILAGGFHRMKLTPYESLRAGTPPWLKAMLGPVRNLFVGKTAAEMRYWQNRHRTEGGAFEVGNYREVMLAMLGESGDAFLHGKVLADFGCGPRGTLRWATGAAFRFGIDVLAQRYVESFPELAGHDTVYVACSEQVIPMPSASVDILITMNALDHVSDLGAICSELLRILKPGGVFAGSFNLNERATAAEPQTLTEELLERVLINRLETLDKRFGRIHSQTNRYLEMLSGGSTYEAGREGLMWYRGQKP